ncbi:CHAT domain-containing protein [Mycena galopus ATCC 62051]|nr:CHAT domain-containing protein [Mycena galopus ATCC 62051]
MHENILLIFSQGDKRAHLLDSLGDICFKQWQASRKIEELNHAVWVYEDAVRDNPTDIGYLEDLETALYSRFEQLGDLNDLDRSLLIQQNVLSLTPDGHPNKLLRLNNLVRSLHTRFTQLGDLNDLTKSLEIQQDVVTLTLDDNPQKPVILNNLASLLHTRFEHLGELDDLNKCLEIQQEVVFLTPDGHPDKALRLNNLGSSLQIRFERLGDLNDLNRSLLIKQDAVSLTPDGHPDKPNRLNNLAHVLHAHFEHLGEVKDLSKSLELQQEAVSLTPDGHPDKAIRLHNLGTLLHSRFERFGDLNDLNRSLSMKQDAVSLTPDGHPDKPIWLSNLARSLYTRFEQLGQLEDLSKCLELQQETVSLTPDGHPAKPQRLGNLATSLGEFTKLGDLEDLNTSLLMQQDVVSLTPDSHQDKPIRLNNLARSLDARFEHLGDLNDLTKSLEIQQDVVSLTLDGNPQKLARLNNLATLLHTRFKNLGELEDLNKCLEMQQEAIFLTPDGHLSKPIWLNNLANYLHTRFEHFGELDDLNKCLGMQQEAVSLTPDGHPNKAIQLSNLANWFHTRFKRLDNLDDLTRSLLINQDAVSLSQDGHPDKPILLDNLARSLHTRFEQFGHIDDLNKCLLMRQDALSLTPDSHPDKPIRLNNLSVLLYTRFGQFGDIDDLNKCLEIQQEAVSLTPDDHPDKAMKLKNLAQYLYARFTQVKDSNDLHHMFLQCDFAAHSITGPARIRFAAASMWARCARIEGHPTLLDAYRVALDLLPELAWLGLSLRDRHHEIMKAGEVVRNAAAASIASGSLEQAVEWLEQGLSIIWGQFLNLRTPVDDLKQKHPALAAELIYLSAQLERAATRESTIEANDSKALPSLDFVAQKSHKNAHKRAELLKKIRNLEGFEHFLMPKTISELSAAVQGGHVILLNLSNISCDALILSKLTNEVLHVPLPEFTVEHSESLNQSLGYLMPSGRSDRLVGYLEGHSADPEKAFAHILSELWVRIVQPILYALKITTPIRDNLQRVWWCPTGPLTSFPIHAAGLYGKNDGFGSKLSDFVISSYTPSLAALIEGFRPRSQEKLQMLAVAQPSAVGQSYIPGTQKEINNIELHVLGKLPILRLEENAATLLSVQEGMMHSSWVHFACHGVQDLSAPTQSALLLAGRERLTLSSIINLFLPHAKFAFLSACQTATGDKNLQEESVHLAAGMLLAGFQGGIATMWTIMDTDAPQVSGDVYDYIFKTSPPDSTRAAEAFHIAIRKLREESGRTKSFFHWVPFIHVGV